MTGDLSPILRAIDCIERRLRGPFRVADAAAAAGYSLFHFSRVFSQTVRQSPYEYLMRRRLSQAALDLLESDRRVLDVALDFQFDTPEGFSRAFKKMFGQQPQQFRKQKRVDPRLLMPRLTQDYLKYLPSIPLAPQQAYLEPVELVGLMTVGEKDANPMPGLLEMVEDEIRAHLHDWETISFYGLTLYLQEWGCSSFVGVPAALMTKIPFAFVSKTLHAGKFACFQCVGSEDVCKHTLAYIFHTWLPHANFSPQVQMVVQLFQRVPFSGKKGDTRHQIYIPLSG